MPLDELFPVALAEQIKCVEREITLRHRVYARRVSDRRMSQRMADREIRAMTAVLETLKQLETKC